MPKPKPWQRAGKSACLNCPDCGALLSAPAAKFHECQDPVPASEPKHGARLIGRRQVIATRGGLADDGELIQLYVVAVPGEDHYPSRARQSAAILGGGFRYRRVPAGWHKQPSGQTGGWVRNHEKTGRPVGRPKIEKLDEFAHLTLRQEFAGHLNGYSLETVQAVLSRGRAAAAVVTLVSNGRRRAAIATAIGVHRKTVDRLFQRGQNTQA
jgi:hypothetical protein